MFEVILIIMWWTVSPVLAAFIGYQFGALRVGLVLLPVLPQELHHRTWGLRIVGHDDGIEFEVGWIRPSAGASDAQ